MKTKATHNGTCQCCGNSQAVNPFLAKHGYTVDFGFFNGVCMGADHAPLEESRVLCDSVCEQLTKSGNDLLAKTVADVPTVVISIKFGGFRNQRTHETIVTNQEDITRACEEGEHATAYKRSYGYGGYGKFEKLQERELARYHRHGKQQLDHAEMMQKRADETTGKKDLEPREVEVQKVRFEIPCRNRDKVGAAAGFKRAKEMKESGLYSRVTVRRPNMYSFAHTVTATPK